MMVEGAMQVDFQDLRRIGERVVDRLAGAVRAHITTPHGTDLWLTVKGREFEHDVVISPGTFGNLPNGEVRAAPVETEAEGTMVCRSTVGDLGKLPSPITIEVAAGRITSIRGDDEGLVERIRELQSIDDEASLVGELGIGINPSARVIGNMLEDEKVAGTVHIAFGNNSEFPGGQNTSRTHRDFLQTGLTMTIEFEDGSTKEIIRDGELLD
jgi:leucyl aminopeptidase (aminopeptidase T)